MAAFVGLCQVTLTVPGSTSLKDKRRVLRSIVDRLRQRYALAVAEVGSQDAWQRADIAFACVSGEPSRCEAILAECVRWLETRSDIELVHVETEIL
ncbi:DUF503 domain-containing protein [Thermaerobacter sp. PB12/4term]|uniref:DUF503 domain-containing protein n=1 Tax=Thermaerobacter sp. PB12/4term TaxID=2293838 RepID=UPI000E3272EF|nr:DUF503 domain-containing protein [Thermaerobacter sp. PB12/4term]QIA26970.1 DUF503 domain-containing protein [Thermaerobacter sp. PB12/4term]